MGVTGLWKLIEQSGKPVPLDTLENKVLAVGELFTCTFFNYFTILCSVSTFGHSNNKYFIIQSTCRYFDMASSSCQGLSRFEWSYITKCTFTWSFSSIVQIDVLSH